MPSEARTGRADAWLYAAIIAYTISVYGTMATMSIGAGALAAAWLITRWGHLRADLARFRVSPLFFPSIALVVACLWSLLWAKASGLTYFDRKPEISWDDTRKAWHVAFPFVLAAALSSLTSSRLRKVAKIWLGFGAASAAFGVLQHYVPVYSPMMLPQAMEGKQATEGFLSHFIGAYHATGFAGFHLSYAAIMAFPAAVWLALLAVIYRREGLSTRALASGAVVLLCYAATIFTYSKIAWVAMPMTVALLGILGFKGKARYAVIAACVAATIAWGASSEVRLRFSGATRTISDRFEIWNANFDMIRKFPIFGVGWHHNSDLSGAYYASVPGYPDHYSLQSHAHNNLIDQLATTGIIGLLAFLWWNWIAVAMSYRIYRDSQDLLLRSLGLGLLGGWFCLHVNGLTQTNWWDAKVLHQIGWVTAFTMEAYRRWRDSWLDRGKIPS
jgi:O-antigen ligase